MSMAGEIGHVVYAARVLNYLGDTVQDPAYYLGTLFCDIRHLGVISRHHTHPQNVSLTELVGKNDFFTGMRVHAWIDTTREHYLKGQHIKETLPWHPFVPHALKLVEDEMLYDTFDDWGAVYRILHTIHEDELYYVQARERIQAWHSILQAYIKDKPNDASRQQLTEAIGLSPASAHEVNTVVKRLQQDPKTAVIVKGFWQYLEDILR